MTLSEATRRDLGGALITVIGAISEEYRCAGWDHGIERELWFAVKFGTGYDEYLGQLRALRDVSGYWATWDRDIDAPVLIPVDAWRERMEANG